MTSTKRNARVARVREGREEAEDWSRRSGLSPELEAVAAQVIVAADEVHRVLGPGLPESSYQMALAHELELIGLSYTREHVVDLSYKGRPIGSTRLDFLVEDRLVVELKSVEQIHDLHKAQVLTYLKVTGLQLGLLINFNSGILRKGTKRIIRSTSQARAPREPSRPSRSSSKDPE